MKNSEERKPERRFTGTAVSRGVGIGRVLILDGTNVPPNEKQRINHADVDREIERYRAAFTATSKELSSLARTDASGVFSVHLLILEDAFGTSVEQAISEGLVTAETAVRSIAQRLSERQRSVPDEHIREKYLDIHDVAERLIRSIRGARFSEPDTSGAVYVVAELTPSRLLELAGHHPQAIIAEHGGWTSHTSILAREYKLPAVTGVHNLTGSIGNGDLILVDGNSGTVILDPSPETIAETAGLGHGPGRSAFSHDVDPETETSDGIPIIVRVNANLPEAYDRARRAGANGIGLYRSEILFDRKGAFPDEEEQYLAYREIADRVGEAGVRIRTFDIGVDRLSNDPRRGQANPALGLRAVRLSLTDQDYFRTQVRAILRANAANNIDIVLPMVSGLSDILPLREAVEEVRRGLPTATCARLGVMIETPSAVMTIEEIARSVDFLCLGTNDLVQYLLAAGRDDPSVGEWYQTLHPAVLSSIQRVIAAGDSAGMPVAVCGEMAGSAYYVPLLIGLGARELSMNVNSVAHIRNVINDLDSDRCRSLAADALRCRTAAQADLLLKEYYSTNWPFLLTAAS